MKSFLITIVTLCSIAGCKNPKKFYEKNIFEENYIPFTSPVTDSQPGSLFYSGTPDDLVFADLYDACFPNENLRSTRQSDLFQNLKNITLSTNIDIGGLAKLGNDLFKFTFDNKKVKKVSMVTQGVTKEDMRAIRLSRFFQRDMDDYCKEYLLENLQFVSGSLKVSSMSFKFINSNNGEIKLSADNISEFVDLSVGAKWEIVNETTLEVKSPKYIGYQMAKFRQLDNGKIALFIATAYNHDSEEYHFIKKFSFDESASHKNEFVTDSLYGIEGLEIHE